MVDNNPARKAVKVTAESVDSLPLPGNLLGFPFLFNVWRAVKERKNTVHESI